jgi:dCTP diphosphatase
MTDADALNRIRLLARRFVQDRNWQTFQTPKNLAMAMIVEASELVEHFQWLTPEQSRSLDPAARQEVADELADVLIYLVRIADELDMDLASAALEKLEKNERKYPVG